MHGCKAKSPVAADTVNLPLCTDTLAPRANIGMLLRLQCLLRAPPHIGVLWIAFSGKVPRASELEAALGSPISTPTFCR